MNFNYIVCCAMLLTSSYIVTYRPSQIATDYMFGALYAICKEPNNVGAIVRRFNSNPQVQSFKRLKPAAKLNDFIKDIMDNHIEQRSTGFEVHGVPLMWQEAVALEAAERYFAFHNGPQIIQKNKNLINTPLLNFTEREAIIREKIWQEFEQAGSPLEDTALSLVKKQLKKRR